MFFIREELFKLRAKAREKNFHLVNRWEKKEFQILNKEIQDKINVEAHASGNDEEDE